VSTSQSPAILSTNLSGFFGHPDFGRAEGCGNACKLLVRLYTTQTHPLAGGYHAISVVVLLARIDTRDLDCTSGASHNADRVYFHGMSPSFIFSQNPNSEEVFKTA